MDKKSKRTPAADAVETIAKEVAVAAIVKKAPALKPIAKPLVDVAAGMSGRPRKKGRKI